ncbi:Chelated iron transport system membrane protein yfeC [Vibrio nigripulchritudo MADA3029]|uniref:Chelated iron transport system membrane protein yfeC n=2 Tax=Vibrio nigripulchritudo TaxID=28173 RepID=U4KFY3_9VIBR|nr:Chelated iron transport system membrane protein yfeC [Vibrio nigripulchritudo ATCC 27043]UAB73293.1 metal ABC transporter permease [Vibrio sp. SCSIO 43132]CCN36653.1 Chelated iron transport system membrane protein yfeC [Vibrio nigripulchritudo AM115]CCN43801.1 Chelated iron transport system membrane protein yfeC [Vibrio nigripulchritudo FTn2]CCN47324.1 Chelated iron transport system membrane protein yfeC [Vibrio nigripulchritudo MADA3020]CCN55189.1 Chelated iron transport system membrane pr
MLEYLLEPLSYQYMLNAIFASAIVGAVCAFLSAFLMLKGWSLIGDALSHSVVPGVAGAYALGLPYAVGAFFSGFLASISIAALKSLSHLKEDAIIGFIFTTFFAAGLLLISLNPTSINVQSIIFGNILSIGPEDLYQIVIISVVSLIVLGVLWKDLMLVFFDETQASAVGLSPVKLKILFFTLLSACTVASLQTVGAVLVIAMVITPGATAYLLTDRFGWLLVIATSIGLLSSGLGAYISYFLDGTTGGIIVLIQTVLFLLAFLFAPKYGLFSDRVAALNRLGNAGKVARDA